MIKSMKIFFAVTIAIFICRQTFAQQDSVRQKTDSVLNLTLDSQLKKIKQISAERLVDSLKRVNL
jgi:hypothetical protein